MHPAQSVFAVTMDGLAAPAMCLSMPNPTPFSPPTRSARPRHLSAARSRTPRRVGRRRAGWPIGVRFGTVQRPMPPPYPLLIHLCCWPLSIVPKSAKFPGKCCPRIQPAGTNRRAKKRLPLPGCALPAAICRQSPFPHSLCAVLFGIAFRLNAFSADDAPLCSGNPIQFFSGVRTDGLGLALQRVGMRMHSCPTASTQRATINCVWMWMWIDCARCTCAAVALHPPTQSAQSPTLPSPPLVAFPPPLSSSPGAPSPLRQIAALGGQPMCE